MAFRSADLRWMVEESMTLSERLDAAVVSGGSGQCAGVAGTRLRKWRNRVANGDTARFAKRLRWDGLDVESVLRLLGPVRRTHPEALPDWAVFLDAATSDTDAAGPGSPGEVFDPHAPQPFEDLLWRLIPEAARRMRAGLGPCRDRFSPAAVADLQRGLLGRLCRTAGRTLCIEFDAFRAARADRLFPARRAAAVRSRGVYHDFVQALDGNEFAAWLLRYPMLGRLLATCCQQWVTSTVDLVRRLDRDADAIRRTLGIPDRPLHVAGVTPNLSDPHRGGQTVCALRFDSGTGLVYKPRGLALDRHFSDLLTALGDMCQVSATTLPKVLDRGDYGWVELVEAAPCTDRQAVQHFYRRAGMLTGLVYALGGSDLHAGNLIAAGEYPVPIDLECIVGAPLDGLLPEGRSGPALGDSPAGSVFRTGMPPVARRSAGGVFRIVGGLADPDPGRSPAHPVVHANTDWMAWKGSGALHQSERNVASLDGRTQPASGYVGPLLEGFRCMYDVLGRKRTRVRSAAAVRLLEREEFRVLIRDTHSYAALLEDALGPQHVTSGPDWSIALDVITAPSLAAAARPPCWATRTAERIELERLDIPLFIGRADQPFLRSSTGMRLEQRLDHAGYAASVRLARLNANDMEQQIGLLETSFSIADVKRRHRDGRARAARHPGGEPLGRQVLAEVHAIVDLLERLAVDDGDAVTWRGLEGPPGIAPTLAPVGTSLFSGTSGIALFLAAAAGVTACGPARVLAARVLDPLSRRLGDRARRLDPASRMSIGGATGLGGLVYALARAGGALGHPGYLTAARAAADAITPAAIAVDDALDVMSGAAGALLGLLFLYRTTGDDSSLRRAVRCGEHLLERRTTDPVTGLRAWSTLPNGTPTGFAHGASGIACALTRLADATGEDAFRRAATEARFLEHRQLARCSTPRREPRPAAPESSGSRRRSWCRGSTGIGLARLDALDDDGPETRSDFDAALEAAKGHESTEADGLCCGRLGRADFLLSSGLRFGRRDLCDAAVTIGRQIMARALAEGRYATGTDEGFRPGLFQGVSGIGYELLRLLAPDTVTSVLLWE